MADDAQAGAAQGAKTSSYTAALYGSIAVTALVAALAGHDASAQKLTLTVGGTMLAFWLAKVWSSMVNERLTEGHGFGFHDVTEVVRKEWPMVESGAVPIAALALAWAGAWSVDTGTHIALGLAVAQLVLWGLVAGRRSHASWPVALFFGAVDGLLGLGIVALEVVVH
jgi:hypothetical protein